MEAPPRVRGRCQPDGAQGGGLKGTILLTAPWVIPIEGPPIEDGALVVSGGQIAAVGTRRQLLASHAGARRAAFDGCALLPTLVNAHAHLELTVFGALPPGTDFVGWLLELIRRKRETAVAAYRAGIAAGALRCLLHGQGMVADELSIVEAADAYPADGPRCLVFPEIIASQEAGVPDALARVRSATPALGAALGGLAPHAPYTVCAVAYREAWKAVAGRGGRLMTHLAESAEEVTFCLRGTGPIADRLYRQLPVAPPPPAGHHPLAWLDRMGLVGPQTILVHAVHLGAEHVDLIARRRAAVVLCPRSNRHLGVGAAPGRALLDAGVVVALGTDSVLSAGGLDLWGDIAAAVDDYGWSPAEAVRAATRGGACALGMGVSMGALTPGRRADILALRLDEGGSVWDRMLASPRTEAVWLGGKPVRGPGANRDGERAPACLKGESGRR